MTTSTAAKKDISKLQRAIVDGLENTKAQDIQVFDTEHLSPLFERVIIASGTSNRQTRALSVSVCDAVRKAGFPKPRVEGETNGEWIIVDCGRAVAHIMQPNHRQYYKLEELWGEKPVRIKLGAEKPKTTAQSSTPAGTAPTKAQPPGLRRSSAAKKGVAEAFPSKAAAKKARATAAAAGGSPAPARKRAAPGKTQTKTKVSVQEQPTAAPAKKGVVASLVSKVAKVVALAGARKPASKP